MGMDGIDSTRPLRDGIIDKLSQAASSAKTEKVNLQEQLNSLINSAKPARPADRIAWQNQIKSVNQKLLLNQVKTRQITDVVTFLEKGKK